MTMVTLKHELQGIEHAHLDTRDNHCILTIMHNHSSHPDGILWPDLTGRWRVTSPSRISVELQLHSTG